MQDHSSHGNSRNRQDTKRPRTTSLSPAAASKHGSSASQPPSDEESKLKASNGTRTQSLGQCDKEPAKEIGEGDLETPDTGSRRKDKTNRQKGDGECCC